MYEKKKKGRINQKEKYNNKVNKNKKKR